MTPDQDLSARLAQLKADEDSHDLAEAFYRTLDTALWVAYDQGQLITIADHERAVQAAVAKAVEAIAAEREACAEMLDNQAEDLEADASRFRHGTDPHHSRMAFAHFTRKQAAAIRSRGVAG